MGRHLLRREDLKKILFFSLIAALAIMPSAAENQESLPEITESPAEEIAAFFAEPNPFFPAEGFSRPLRSRKETEPDIRQLQSARHYSGNSAWYSAGHSPVGAGYGENVKSPKSTILTEEALANPLTQYYIRQYSLPAGLSWLTAAMKRGGPYLAFIRKETAERKLPGELVYIPVIESGYLPAALSRSGAAGLWQFMKNSIAPFDMKVNDWIDERRDFWKSTQGALRKLEENYRHFGDWPLALAAYNAGLGAISRAVQQSGIKDYWVLSQKELLKTETIHYVPKLIAAAYILSNPRQFGIEPLWPGDPEWTRVAVSRSADLRILANEAGVDREELMTANQELLYGVTPPGQDYLLKVPGKYAENITAVMRKNDITLINYYFHTIQSGDTLLALAQHYGIKTEQIIESNPGIQERFLKIGSRLIIPALKETAPYQRPAHQGINPVFEGSHLVKKGETLWSIALGYNITPEDLAEANGMELTDVLREGKTIKTPIK